MSTQQRTVALMTGIALAGLAVVYRQVLEATMARHMLLQIPMLIAAGALVAFGMPRMNAAAFFSGLRGCDENGITGLFAFMLVTAYWMIPKALDSAAVSLVTDTAKFMSLLLAGLLLPGSLSRANTILQLFFIGNFASMTAIAGMLYQDAPRRLCNLYLIDDQMIAGTALVTLAVAIALLWCVRQFITAARIRPELEAPMASVQATSAQLAAGKRTGS
jgi:hypothetical protein